MPDLSFRVQSVAPLRFAAVPMISFELGVANAGGESIHSVALRCQIQIEVTRRRYNAQDQERLGDLFGEPSRWGRTLRPMLWTHASTVVPSFTESATVDLQVPCTFDFNVAATKYFDALQDGEVPLCFLFSGTVFYQQDGDVLQAAPIAWDKEARFRLPVEVWRGMMDLYYPGVVWLSLRRDLFERLGQYKSRHGSATWEQALESLLAQVEEVACR